jgi:hypothetical protein
MSFIILTLLCGCCSGEPIVEPEVDLSTFLEKQRISELDIVLGAKDDIDEDEVDMTLAHISSYSTRVATDRKGKVQEIQWDREMDEMSKEKAVAEAQRGAFSCKIFRRSAAHGSFIPDLKARFKAKSEKLKAKPVFKSTRERQAEKYEQAPELPTATPAPPKDSKVAMEEFLDDLLG